MVQLLAIGFLLFALILVTTTLLARRAASREALADARATTDVLARSVAEPALPRGLAVGSAGAVDRLDREVVDRLFVGDVMRIKIWSPEGRILYSDRTELIGRRFPLGEEEQEILRDGGTDAEVSDLTKPENRFERDLGEGGLVEVYTRITSPEGEPLLFEAYYSADDIEQRQRDVLVPFQRISVGSLLALLLLATALVWMLTRRLTRTARDRERLLVSAADVSEAERQRIARDLHDGVVQDLAGVAFSVSALARDPGTPAGLRPTLERAAASLRSGLRSLRSLLVEIHPPDLRADGLSAALQDLTAPAASAGIVVSVAVSGVDDVPDETVALVWRVAQEAVRNAVRHASPGALSVVVRGTDRGVVLEVVDDGVGFDPTGARDPAHYGLRGLTSLVAEAGGRLEVRSAPGSGTTVHLEIGRA